MNPSIAMLVMAVVLVCLINAVRLQTAYASDEIAADFSPAARVTSSMPSVSGFWHPLGNTAPYAGRSSAAVVWTGSEMILWGGNNGSFPTGERYDSAANVWKEIATNGAPTAVPRAVIWTGSELLVWGGYFAGYRSGSGGRYDPLANRWTPIAANGPLRAREGHTAVWTGREMIIWGGHDGSINVNDSTVQSSDRHVDSDLNERSAKRAECPHCGLDRHGNDRLGWFRQHRATR